MLRPYTARPSSFSREEPYPLTPQSLLSMLPVITPEQATPSSASTSEKWAEDIAAQSTLKTGYDPERTVAREASHPGGRTDSEASRSSTRDTSINREPKNSPQNLPTSPRPSSTRSILLPRWPSRKGSVTSTSSSSTEHADRAEQSQVYKIYFNFAAGTW